MNIKEKLLELKARLSKKKEEEIILEDHPLVDTNIFRLFFIDFHYNNKNRKSAIIWAFKPFSLPEGMTSDEAFKVLSYLTDYIERNVKPYTLLSVQILDRVLDLKRLGFKRLNIDSRIENDNINNIFTISGNIQLFKNSEYYSKYFEWYTEGVTFEEVKNIYSKYNIEFYDLIPQNEKITKQSQLLKKVRSLN